MSVEALDIAKPFFDLLLVSDESNIELDRRSIVLNLDETRPLWIEGFQLPPLSSVIVEACRLSRVSQAVLVQGFDDHESDQALISDVTTAWPLAFDVRKEERLRGVQHYMGPKVRRGQIALGLYCSTSVPLNVGLHREHPWCEVPGFKEVHTQIVGYGKMQQCRERDLSTLYLEEFMAPGVTHKPMYDEVGNYPWHQFETVTPSIFMAVEILPQGA